MRKLFYIVLPAIMLTSCVTSSVIHYPPSRWIKDTDRTPIEMPKVEKQRKPPKEGYDKITYQAEQIMQFSEQLAEMPKDITLSGWQEALNVNNFDETADSTWFTNRIGKEMAKNIFFNSGPKKPWKVLASKDENKVSEIVIIDKNKDEYLLKIGRSETSDLEIGAEIIASLILYNAGYNMLENYIVELTEKDAAYRSLAIKIPKGRQIGHFTFHGKRHDDSNDRIPHEHRREIRAFLLFCALLNSKNIGEQNTLDMFTPLDENKGFVEHYISNLSNPLSGIHLETKDDMTRKSFHAVDALFSFGFYNPYWTTTDKPVKTTYSGVVSSEDFKPQKWRPYNQNTAFKYMTDRDAFWAAKILAKFSDSLIEQIVTEAHYKDPEITKQVIKTLIARRDKIVNYWFNKLNPLDNFSIGALNDETVVQFDDLAPQEGTLYRYRVQNLTGDEILSDWKETPLAKLAVNNDAVSNLDKGKIYMINIQTKRKDQKWWSNSVDAFIKNEGNVQLMGIQRRYR